MIIKSLLDQDQYKFSMAQAVLHQFPATQAKYAFSCRNKGVDLVPYATEIRNEIDSLGELSFADDELEYVSKLRFIKPDFVEFLRNFRLSPRFVKISTDGGFKLTIEGPWLHTIMFEVLVLAIVNEVYFKYNRPENWLEIGMKNLKAKADLLKDVEKSLAPGFQFAEFGTRRRFSREWHKIVTTGLSGLPQCVGTSNMLLAMKLGMKPIGTCAHEWFMGGQAVKHDGFRIGLADSQKYMLDCWVREYRGDLGIALSDTLGINAFLRDFDLYFAKLYSGIRHDSGDPYAFGEKVIAHYEKLGIDPMTKTLVFTDSLDIPRALKIHDTFRCRIKTSFGIGTDLTNSCGAKPINIVIKLVECNNQPVAKLSDDPGKQACGDTGYLAYLKSVFGRTD